MGPYKLSKELLKKIPMNERLKLVKPSYFCSEIEGFSVYIDESHYYLTKRSNPAEVYTPKVGDYRIKYLYLAVGTNVSMMGAQLSTALEKYKGKLLICESGLLSASKLLSQKKNSKSFRQYIVRVLSLISILIGYVLVT